MSTSYTYRKLDPEKQEIRLLVLLPGERDEAVRAIVKHASIMDGHRPPYETISYAWGEITRSAAISFEADSILKEAHRYALDKKWPRLLTSVSRWLSAKSSHPLGILSVPANTEAALKRVRLVNQPRIVWIDAVCINQDDLAERSQQVAIMGRIYASSTGNLVYLGELNDDYTADRVSETIEALRADAERKTEGFKTFISTIIDDKAGTWLITNDKLQVDVNYTVLVFVLELPWFRRLWVLQEAALSPENTAFLGPLQIDFLDLIRAILWFCHHNPFRALSLEVVLGRQCLAYIGFWTGHEHSLQAGRPRMLGDLLNTARYFERHESKDGVFAILPLLTGALPSAMTPDYEKPLSEILQTATRCALAERGDIWLLSRVFHRRGDLECANIASWAIRADRRYDQRVEPVELPGFYNACGGLGKAPTISNVHIYNPSVLRAAGIIVDKVAKVTPSCTFEKWAMWESRVLWIREATRVYQDSTNARDRPQALRVLATTLVAGKIRFGGRLSGRGAETMESCLDLFWGVAQVLVEEKKLDMMFSNIRQDYSWHSLQTRRLFVTRTGRPGLGPQVMRVGDVVTVLRGGDLPFVLRPLEGDQYQLVGAAYVYGIMDGEAVAEHKDNGGEEVVFELV